MVFAPPRVVNFPRMRLVASAVPFVDVKNPAPQEWIALIWKTQDPTSKLPGPARPCVQIQLRVAPVDPADPRVKIPGRNLVHAIQNWFAIHLSNSRNLLAPHAAVVHCPRPLTATMTPIVKATTSVCLIWGHARPYAIQRRSILPTNRMRMVVSRCSKMMVAATSFKTMPNAIGMVETAASRLVPIV